MTKRLLSVLLLSAAFPLAAVAQTTSGEAGTTITNPSSPADKEAQSATPMDQSADAGATTAGPFVTVPETGAWRASDLEGKDVYGADGESIGSISDVLLSQDGSVNAVIIGVGGFLGMGEKDVAVDMSALELGPGDTQAEANAASAANPEAVPGDVSGETTASTSTGTAMPPAGETGTATTGADTAMTNDNAASSNTTTGTGMPATGDDQQMAANEAGDDGAIMIGTDGLPERIVLNVTRQQLEDAPAFEGLRSETQGQQ